MDIVQPVHFETDLACAFSPLLYLIIVYAVHYPSTARLNYQKSVFLHSYPNKNLVKFFHERIAPEKVCAEPPAFGQDFQELLSRPLFGKVPDLCIFLDDMFHYLLPFRFDLHKMEFSSSYQILRIEYINSIVICLRMHF